MFKDSSASELSVVNRVMDGQCQMKYTVKHTDVSVGFCNLLNHSMMLLVIVEST